MEKYIRGFLRIKIYGCNAERFFNLCKVHHINLTDIRVLGDTQYTALVSVNDFFHLRTIRNKSKVHIAILKKYGLPFFFSKNKKRKAFFLGIILSLGFVMMMSSHIWNIEVTGNNRNSTAEIIGYLNQEGIHNGISKSKLDCNKIASILREKYTDIAWVSARVHGTNLILTVKEALPKSRISYTNKPCNLSAKRDGTIVKIITRQGIPMVHPGDICKKGDILISGELPVINDDQEVVRISCVRADGDIFISYSQKYHNEFPLQHKVYYYDGSRKHGFSISVLKKHLELYPAIKIHKNWKCVEEYHHLNISEFFSLPIVFKKALFNKYKTKNAVYNEQQARIIAQQQFQQYEKKLLEQGIEITKNNIKVEVTASKCVVDGTITLIEKNSEETPIFSESPVVQ